MKMSDEKFVATIEEIGVMRMSDYLKAYKSVKGDNDLFLQTFRDYLDSRPKTKDDYLKISIFSFKRYVSGLFSLKSSDF